VTVRFPLSRRALPRTLGLALCVALVPLPVAASESATAPQNTVAAAVPQRSDTPALRAAIERVDSRKLDGVTVSRTTQSRSRTAARRSDQAQNPAADSPAFFKTGAGIAVIAAVAAGVGYALYSTSHDRINSPGRQ
jgi:hypothetical protein